MGVYLFDQYSALHFAQGVVAYFWNVDPVTFLLSHALFELVENSDEGIRFINEYVTWWPGGKDRPDSLMNILGDNISANAGYWFARWLDAEGVKQGWYQPRPGRKTKKK